MSTGATWGNQVLTVSWGINQPLAADHHRTAWAGMQFLAEAFEVPLLMCAGERDVLDRQAAADREWFDEHVRPLDAKTPPRV